MKKTLLMALVLSVYTCVDAQVQKTDSLSLEYSSFGKLFRTYKRNGSTITKDEFRGRILSNKISGSKYQRGRDTRIASGVVGAFSLLGVVYFTREWLQGDVLANPPNGYFASYFGLVGAAMLNLRGKQTIQVAINEYNGSPVTVENPIRINLSTGIPAYGVGTIADEDATNRGQSSLGVGVEAHLYKNYFGFVDAYKQSSVTEFSDAYIDNLVFIEDGYTVLSGIGANYKVTKKIRIIAKYGIGYTTINRVTTFDGVLLSKDQDERWGASQLGLGLRYFPLKNFAVGANVNLSTSTPLFGFELTAAL